jgi:hypothetical protein
LSSVSDALAGFKAVLAAIDPSPQPDPANIYEWPDDYATFDYTTFPFIIVAQVVNEDFTWQPAATGVGYHNWAAEILIMLANGPTTRMEAQKDAEVLHEPWLLATAKILFNNQGVDGTALNIGTAEALTTYRVGNVGWDNQVFWGIRWVVPVRQEHSLPSF